MTTVFAVASSSMGPYKSPCEVWAVVLVYKCFVWSRGLSWVFVGHREVTTKDDDN